VPFRHAGNEIGLLGKRQRAREPSNNRNNLARQAEHREGLIDWPPLDSSPRDKDMPAGSITAGSHLPLRQRMAGAHGANQAIAEQQLGPYFWSRILSDNAGLQINRSVAKQRAVLVQLWHEAQADPRCLRANTSDQVRTPSFHKTIAGPQGESADKLLKIERF